MVVATAASDPGGELSRRSYLPHEVEAALQALVLAGGSVRRAARVSGVPRETLRDWALVHRERIEAIRVERGPELERMAIEGFRAFVVRAEEVKTAALEKTLEGVESGELDPGRALQQVSIAQGISVQRGLELDGRPSGVSPSHTLEQLYARLAGLARPVEGSAVELLEGSDGEGTSCPMGDGTDRSA